MASIGESSAAPLDDARMMHGALILVQTLVKNDNVGSVSTVASVCKLMSLHLYLETFT